MRLRATRTFIVSPKLPARLGALVEVASNLFWTWNTDAVALFKRTSPERWEQTGHNPVRLIQLLSLADLERLEQDEGYLAHLDRVAETLRRYLARPAQHGGAFAPGSDVLAYFSLEFALTESFPSYSGGLGVLAGDHLKSASDLGLPLVAVGLFYREGYFQQSLGPDGSQVEEYHEVDPAHHPLKPMLDAGGGAIRITAPIDGRDVAAAIWRLDLGQVPVFLLDTDLPENAPEDRAITGRLYGGDLETRIKQEIVLGIGGVRALHALGYHASVCHMNEGHSALLGLERIRLMMAEHHVSFEEARLPVSAATVFTTHTAVAAGIDLFPPQLALRYLAAYGRTLGLDENALLGLGRSDPGNHGEPFSMAMLGLRLSGYRNGVSRLHGEISRELWQGAWPHLPVDQTPIKAITNGVHLPTWVAHDLGELYDGAVGPHWRDDPVSAVDWQRVQGIADEELWAARERARARLVVRARVQHRESAARRGGAPHGILGEPLDPRVLTIGFARRFAAYKRATLLFRDPERLARLLNHPDRPVQFIFAGKAHPKDEAGKQLIREVVAQSRKPEFRDRLVVLEHYDVDLARALVQGADVWLNTPLRPLEASGTSGMKAVANGALHLSILDGWWAEAYRPGLGWAIGRNRSEDNTETQDEYDAASLYDLLEHEVATLFYDRDTDGLPRDWLRRMKSSVGAFAPQFSTHRMVLDYMHQAYSPAAASWHKLVANGAAAARELQRWIGEVRSQWPHLRVLSLSDDQPELAATGAVTVRLRGDWAGLRPEDLRVDLMHGPAQPGGELAHAQAERMRHSGQGQDGAHAYEATFTPSEGGRTGYAVRVLPAHADLHNAFDLGLVLWA